MKAKFSVALAAMMMIGALGCESTNLVEEALRNKEDLDGSVRDTGGTADGAFAPDVSSTEGDGGPDFIPDLPDGWLRDSGRHTPDAVTPADSALPDAALPTPDGAPPTDSAPPSDSALPTPDADNGFMQADAAPLPEDAAPPPDAAPAELCNGVLCDDGNPCTLDTCNPASGRCASAPVANHTFCDDGDLCTNGDVCQEGVCSPGLPINCEDGDNCTIDSCDPRRGCQNEQSGYSYILHWNIVDGELTGINAREEPFQPQVDDEGNSFVQIWCMDLPAAALVTLDRNQGASANVWNNEEDPFELFRPWDHPLTTNPFGEPDQYTTHWTNNGGPVRALVFIAPPIP